MPSFDDYAQLRGQQAARFTLGPKLQQAVLAAPFPGLTDGPHDVDLASVLRNPDELAWAPEPENGEETSSTAALRPLPSLALSGLWLLAGDLDRSHAISQDESSGTGSYWHGIMHRREGDYSNAGYWFRRVGSHPVLDQLAELFPDEHSDAEEFIARVRRACRGNGDTQILLQVQWAEWQLLMAASLFSG